MRVDALRTAATAYDGVVALAASGAAGLAAPAPGGGPVDAAVAEALAALHEAFGRLEDSHRHVAAALVWAADELERTDREAIR